jgi:hypothetical protein
MIGESKIDSHANSVNFFRDTINTNHNNNAKMDKDELISQFINITNGDITIARNLLETTKWNLDAAIDL